jgi:acyl dehydratase
VSADNHPIHYNVEYARSHGHTAPVVHGLQVREHAYLLKTAHQSTSEAAS